MHCGKFRLPQKLHKEELLAFTSDFGKKLHSFLYIVGIQSVRILKRCRRRTKRFLRPVTHLLGRAYQKLIGRRVTAVKKECLRIREGFSIAGKRIRASWDRNPLHGVVECFRVTGRSMVRHRRILFGAFNVLAPVAAVILLVFTVQYWTGQNLGLVLALDGDEIATIADERVFEEATEMVNGRLVTDALGSSRVGVTPTYTLAVVDRSRYASSNTLCDKLIELSSGVIEDASGLYVDGKLIGAVKSNADLTYLLQSVLNQARGGNTEAEVSFTQNIETVPGLYPVESIISSEEMKSILFATTESEKYHTVKAGDTPLGIAAAYSMDLDSLQKMNADTDIADLMYEGEQVKVAAAKSFLTVQLTQEETYEEEIPYQTVTVKDDTKYTDYSKVTVAGQNGSQTCVDRVTYIDGEEVSREAVSRTTTQEPVNKQIVVGTKKRPTYSGSGQSSGSLMWPVPYTHYIFQSYHAYHNGIDIAASGIQGQTIVAADGGTVVSVQYLNYGYGYHVIIDHGNGMRTLYAHASRIYVTPGQQVSKGQAIAAVGSTGNSTGYHLHFEVIVNGVRYNPTNYCR